MMPVMCVSAVLLCSMVADISARALTATSAVDQPTLSARQYQHTDPNSGTKLACLKCPAGTYVSTHCSPSSVRECAPCPEGTFTRGENGVQQCHRCHAQCPVGFTEKVPCTKTQDRVCACPPNSFSSGGVDGGCKPHSLCPPGTRVKKRGSQTEDVLCRPCTKGTFSNVESRATKCRNHTDCQALGLVLLTPGTKETDTVCGPPSTTPPLLSPSSSFGPQHAALKQEPISSTLTSLLYGPAHKGTYSQLASLQQKTWSGEDQKSEGVLFNQPDTPTPPNQDPPWTLLASAHKQLKDRESEFEQENSDSIPRPGKQALEGLESSQRGRAGMSKTAGQGSGGGVSNYYRPTHRGSPRPSIHDHFDINEHLPWMIVLLLLLVLVVIVVCSVKRSSRVLKKGPMQDPSSIMEKSIQKKSSAPPTQVREKWIYCCNGQGLDILKLVAAHVGAQWIDIYQSLANATEREVAAFSNGYSSDHERAYAALQHWTIRDSDANLAKLINALHRQRRIDVVEKIRCVMEDNPQFDTNQLMTSVNVSHSLSPIHKPLESPTSVGSSGSVGRVSGIGMEQSPIDRTKGFFPDESEPLLRCDSTSSKDSALSRNGSFITKEKKDTVLRQVRLDPCDLQPIFDDMLHILHPEELHILEKIPAAEDKLDQLFEIAGTKSQEASQTLLDSVYSHFPDLL